MRTSILRATPLPIWIQNGAEFGEERFDLEFDHCLVEVARLRCNSQTLLKDLKESYLPDDKTSATLAQTLIEDCQAVDGLLAAWAASLPQSWDFQAIAEQSSLREGFAGAGISYNGNVHIYPSREIAVAWNRYRAARLICNSIILKATPYCFSMVVEATREEDLSNRSIAQRNIKALTDDICASIPFHFGRTEGLERTTEGFGGEASSIAGARGTARGAFLLVWPLLISSMVWGVRDEQRRWIKAQLNLVGHMTASTALQSIAAER